MGDLGDLFFGSVQIVRHSGGMTLANALVTGGSGLVGRALLPSLSGAVVLSRDPTRVAIDHEVYSAVRWDAERELAPLAALRGRDVIFHLAGEPVAGGRWTEGRKRSIRDSRVLGTRNLVAGLAALQANERPKVLVSASAIGVYGDRGDEMLDELSAPGRGFLAEVCAGWEREAMAAERLGVRVVCARIGIVLAPDGGALAQMLPPFKLGAGGRLGSGAQWMSWIHLDDVVGLLLHAAREDSLHGLMNVVAPQPVRNADFTKALGQALHRPAVLVIPKAVLKLAYGEMSEIMLASQRVVPELAQLSGYAFKHRELAGALAAALAASQREAA